MIKTEIRHLGLVFYTEDQESKRRLQLHLTAAQVMLGLVLRLEHIGMELVRLYDARDGTFDDRAGELGEMGAREQAALRGVAEGYREFTVLTGRGPAEGTPSETHIAADAHDAPGAVQ